MSLPPFLCHIVKLSFVIFGLCASTCFSVKESLVCFPLERKRCRYHVFLTKRSHVASSPSVWIDKDFWFQSSPFPPFSPLSLLPSLPLSSFILCIFGIERLGENERENHCEKNIGRRAQERERDSFGVKGEVSVSSFLLLLSDWPFGAVTQSWPRPERSGCAPFRWRNRKRQGLSRGRGSRGWG